MKSEMLFPTAAFAFFCLPLTAAPIVYNVVNLGSLSGSSAAAASINASGATAGTHTDAYGNARAFSLTVDITPATAAQATAASINSSGQIAGTSYIGDTPYSTVWTGGIAQFLSANAYGMGINDSGQLTGMFTTATGAGHAFLMTAGVLEDLGVLPGGGWSSGYAVNAAGTVVGYSQTASGAFRGFVRLMGGEMQTMATLGGSNSYAMAINAAGQVAGSAQTAAGYLHAVILQSGALADLGSLGGGSSYGYGINGEGTVVGYSSTNSGASHAFLYRNGSMQDLNSLILASTGWVLSAAYGINDAGQIVGSGWLNGIEYAVRLDPMTVARSSLAEAATSMTPSPEPGSLTLFAGGAAMVSIFGVLQRRRQVAAPSRPAAKSR